MIKTLYETFQHWSDSGSVWLISDPHFEDDDCLLMNPNWMSVDQYVENLNKKVHKSDTLICLGDVGNIEYIRKIKAGHKVLITGNHDKGNDYYRRNVINKIYDSEQYTIKQIREELISQYPGYSIQISDEYFDYHRPFTYYKASIDNKLFDEIYDGALFISDKILLSHEPVFGLPFCLNIHGHCHNGTHLYSDDDKCKHINIAADVINYEPINLGEIIKSGILSNIDTIHRLTIDKAIDNSIHKKGDIDE